MCASGALAMSSEGSVTHWIDRLKLGDPAAAEQLWQAYFRRLVGLARKKLEGTPRRAADEEDVALSAFDSFCRGAEEGRFPHLLDRDNLWRLLVTITARKAYRLALHEGRDKRGGNSVLDEAALAGPGEPGLEQLLGREPTPDFAARMAEDYQELLARLDDAALRRVTVWKMEGYSNEEIAVRLGCVPRTVERKLALIRTVWSQEE
jgi:DNA-directed RNA polymerase specialized sigma24 family protein